MPSSVQSPVSSPCDGPHNSLQIRGRLSVPSSVPSSRRFLDRPVPVAVWRVANCYIRLLTTYTEPCRVRVRVEDTVDAAARGCDLRLPGHRARPRLPRSGHEQSQRRSVHANSQVTTPTQRTQHASRAPAQGRGRRTPPPYNFYTRVLDPH